MPSATLLHGLTVTLEDPLSIEPISYTKAFKFLHWQQAMKEEHDAFLQNQTWSLVPVTSHMKIVGCKPLGFVDSKHSQYVCRLHKAPYILK